VLVNKGLTGFAPAIFSKLQEESEKKEERPVPQTMPCIVLPMMSFPRRRV